MPIAKNDDELIRMLAKPVVNGLKFMGKTHLEKEIENVVNQNTHRGSYYADSKSGSLAMAWTTESEVGFSAVLGSMETYYDASKLEYASWGRHQTPEEDMWYDRTFDNIERISDMATLIDQGLGGSLFGENNPTRVPTNFWQQVIDSFDANQRKWITHGFRMSGLKVL